ncbi:MAG: FISUMP domain-containing protein [Bacteroidota bacterium]
MKKRNSITAIPIIMMGILLFVSCSNSKNIYNSKPDTGSFTDLRDGKTYKTVKVGDQWIMAENLAYKPDSGNYWAYDNVDSNIAIYGYLYDRKTAMNIAPEGWHLPSRKEWMAIQKILGAKLNIYPYLEKIYPKLIVGGSSGLDMLLGGMRTCDGEFKYLGDKARFWNSDNSGSEKAAYGLYSNKDSIPHGLRGSKAPHVFNNGFQRTCPGYNVRLFKDK